MRRLLSMAWKPAEASRYYAVDSFFSPVVRILSGNEMQTWISMLFRTALLPTK